MLACLIWFVPWINRKGWNGNQDWIDPRNALHPINPLDTRGRSDCTKTNKITAWGSLYVACHCLRGMRFCRTATISTKTQVHIHHYGKWGTTDILSVTCYLKKPFWCCWLWGEWKDLEKQINCLKILCHCCWWTFPAVYWCCDVNGPHELTVSLTPPCANSVTLYTEFLPTKSRAKCIILISVWTYTQSQDWKLIEVCAHWRW